MQLGIHINKKSKLTGKDRGELSSAIQEDLDRYGLNAAQIFTHGPRALTANKVDYNLVNSVSADINLTVHGSYLLVELWKFDKKTIHSAKGKKYVAAVKSQLEACQKVGAWGLVLHVTKVLPERVVEVMEVLKPLAKKVGVKIILEMTASIASDGTYETPEKIHHLTSMIGPNESYWGWCIDTAHIWAADVSDVKHYETMKNWFDRLTHKKKILLIHLNGSFSLLGSGKDKHAIPFETDDKIWHGISPENSGVKAIVEFTNQHDIPMICEINFGSEHAAIHALEAIKNLG